MKRLLLLFALLFLAPQLSEAKRARVYEKWVFRSGEDIEAWETAGLEEVELVGNEIRFDVKEQAVFYRPLPVGFRKNVDALRVEIRAKGMEDVALLFVDVDDNGEIIKRTRLSLGVREGDGSEYIPLDFYPKDLYNADIFALSFKGTADDVVFGSVRFLHYTALEKLNALWKSFWTTEEFSAHTINLLLGPAMTTDAGPFDRVFQWHTKAVSANAYLLVFLSISGCALLFFGCYKTQKGRSWESEKKKILCSFFLIIGTVWLFYDVRMGWEFVRNVARDHVEYIAAPVAERRFRDHGRFYDFTAFAEGLVADEEGYEVILPNLWPYLGLMRYLTYPIRPHGDMPQYRTWAVWNRPDISVVDKALRIQGVEGAFTGAGEVIGRFDRGSFVFREFPPAPQ
jgi:hypothetical protein